MAILGVKTSIFFTIKVLLHLLFQNVLNNSINLVCGRQLHVIIFKRIDFILKTEKVLMFKKIANFVEVELIVL